MGRHGIIILAHSLLSSAHSIMKIMSSDLTPYHPTIGKMWEGRHSIGGGNFKNPQSSVGEKIK